MPRSIGVKIDNAPRDLEKSVYDVKSSSDLSQLIRWNGYLLTDNDKMTDLILEAGEHPLFIPSSAMATQSEVDQFGFNNEYLQDLQQSQWEKEGRIFGRDKSGRPVRVTQDPIGVLTDPNVQPIWSSEDIKSNFMSNIFVDR